MGHNGCLMFCQITADEERRVSRRIIVVEHPSLVYPQFRPLPAHSIPQTRPLRLQLLEQLNDGFHKSQHELSRHGRRMLMWKVVQAWGPHRPTFCPFQSA